MAKYKAKEKCFVGGKLRREGAVFSAEFEKDKAPKYLEEVKEQKPKK